MQTLICGLLKGNPHSKCPNIVKFFLQFAKESSKIRSEHFIYLLHVRNETFDGVEGKVPFNGTLLQLRASLCE